MLADMVCFSSNRAETAPLITMPTFYIIIDVNMFRVGISSGRGAPADLRAVLEHGLRKGARLDRDQLFQLVYDELRRIAAFYLSHERPGATLQPTALVNEAYLKLQREHRLVWRNRTHFLAIAARAMRQVLIDVARKRRAQKRAAVRVDTTLSSFAKKDELPLEEFITVHRAMEKLATVEPNGGRQARLIQYVWLGGMNFSEAAEELGISRRQAHRDWAFARTWLERELTQ
jgi:RNA polymerase sigma factor (TIGR02999 family)